MCLFNYPLFRVFLDEKIALPGVIGSGTVKVGT